MIETTLTGKTPDIGEENIKKLMTMFPEVVTEGKVDFEKLKQLLGEYVDDSNERYNFTWNGKGRALRLSQTPSLGTLRPCKEESKDWDTTQNLYIEGDNLEVLKLLQKSYYGKIKMIYIDPPYNTGKDFVYRDDFHDSLENYKRITGQVDGNGKAISTNTETSGRYHTDWLNMMYPRLRLARNLLTEDGVIFISIDDNEVHNLRKICDEVFGEDNFLATITVNKASQIATENTVDMHEYVLIYLKNVESFKLGENYKFTISRGTVGNENQTTPKILFPKGLNCYNIEDGVYKTTRKVENSKENIINFGDIVVKDGKLAQDVILQARWRSSNDMRNFFNNNCQPTESKINGEIVEIYFENDRFVPQIKKRVREKFETLYSTNKRGSKYLENINLNYFEHPKDVLFIKYLIARGAYRDSIILDFFSGSATTAHAVMELNAEDGGNRKFIMVQLPEPTDEKSEAYKAGYKNICEIGKERIRRAGEKIKEEYKDKENIENLDIGFKVFKLDTSNIRKWQPDYDNLEQSLLDYIDNFVEGRTDFDVVYEIMLKYGLDLTYPVDEFTISGKKVYSIGFGMLMICLDDEITTEVAKGILTKIKELSPESSRVVFKDNGFKSDSNKTNIKEILKSGGIEEFITI